jgi:hypothetical protein
MVGTSESRCSSLSRCFSSVRVNAAIDDSRVALGPVVFTSREHMIALEPRGKGLLGITLRYPYEVRKEEEYFEDIPDEKIPKDMLELGAPQWMTAEPAGARLSRPARRILQVGGMGPDRRR